MFCDHAVNTCTSMWFDFQCVRLLFCLNDVLFTKILLFAKSIAMGHLCKKIFKNEFSRVGRKIDICFLYTHHKMGVLCYVASVGPSVRPPVVVVVVNTYLFLDSQVYSENRCPSKGASPCFSRLFFSEPYH